MSSWVTCSRWSFLGRGIELNDLQRSLSTLVIMWFCIFVIHCFYHHWIFANSALLSNQQNLLRVWKIKNFLLWYSLSRICMKITMSVCVQWGVMSGCKLYPLALFCWRPLGENVLYASRLMHLSELFFYSKYGFSTSLQAQ